MATNSLRAGSSYGEAVPFRSRDGLSPRPSAASKEIQLLIDPMYLDDELTGLHHQVRRFRNVSFLYFRMLNHPFTSQIEENGCLEVGTPPNAETKKFLTHKNSDAESFNLVKDVEHKRRHIPSASSALFIGGILGVVQAILLISAAKPFLSLLSFMGVTSISTLV